MQRANEHSMNSKPYFFQQATNYNSNQLINYDLVTTMSWIIDGICIWRHKRSPKWFPLYIEAYSPFTFIYVCVSDGKLNLANPNGTNENI